MKIEFVCDKNNWKINRNSIGYIVSIYHEKSVFFLLNDKTIFVAVNSEIGECKKMKHTYSFKEFVDKGTFESDPQSILEESIEQWENQNRWNLRQSNSPQSLRYNLFFWKIKALES